MTKGVFTYKPSSRYDDEPSQRYHFPRTYLGTVEKIVEDFVVYYEPGRIGEGELRGGRRAYFATARVMDIQADQRQPGHYYAIIDPASYVEFEQLVPFRIEGRYLERRLRKADGSTNRGLFGRAVRTLEEDEFELILQWGFSETLRTQPNAPEPAEPFALAEGLAPFERPVVETVIQRPVRDRAFARRVLSAYEARCAVTGLRIKNGRGRPEAQAAHIQPVAQQGPDTVRNGIALSATVHWMFDRGLLTLDDDYRIILSRAAELPPEMSQLIRPGKRVLLPPHPADRPHPRFLAYHREHVFWE